MKGVLRPFGALLIIVALALQAVAQPSLQFFTNQANVLLESQYGFGVTNIPVYCATNSAVSYTGSLHYLLQSAANAYDATTPATNFPSVFRPLFGWESNTLYIIGYATVTNDFYSQTGTGFKELNDQSITTNDNVWGIPWVVGAKGSAPAFDGYACTSGILAARKVYFVRYSREGQPDTNRPPQYTNQFFFLSVSNLIGVQAMNPYLHAYTNSVTMVVSNRVCFTLTNNFDSGTNFVFSSGTSIVSNSWPSWGGNPEFEGPGFAFPYVTNITTFPIAYWSESSKQFVPAPATNPPVAGLLVADLMQTGWPVHDWVLTVSNDLMFAIIDNPSGRVLDYVNLGLFGTFLNITNELIREDGLIGEDNWGIGNATDAANSPMSQGLLNQVGTGDVSDPLYGNSLNGTYPNYGGSTFGADYNPSNAMVQTGLWQPINPRVHYTLQDLTTPASLSLTPENVNAGLAPLTNNLYRRQPSEFYKSGLVEKENLESQNGVFQIQFPGVVDMPYAIWSSSDLQNWSQIGVAAQPAPGNFQFTDPTSTNSLSRFYEVRLP